jgi:IS5 family transposase
MRKLFEVQLALGAVPIEKIEFPLKSRDELPPTLAALQWIFITPEVNKEIFELLEKEIISDRKATGRPGMDLWQILVLGVVRMTLDVNYDRLHHVANYDSLVRQLLGQKAFDMEMGFKLSTIKENIPLLSEELLAKINAVVVRHGHDIIKKKEEEKLEIKIDSYVFETNAHFPTDLNLAWDCARKCITLTARIANAHGLEGWRKHKNWLSKIKGRYLQCSRSCRGGGKNKADRVIKRAEDYLNKLRQIEAKVEYSLLELSKQSLTLLELAQREEIKEFHDLLTKHISLIFRRLINEEIIPPEDKLYSIFEQHTEWISKGKSRPNVELGHRLLIATDQYSLIHDYKIMTGGDEAAEVIPLVDRLLEKYGEGSIGSLSSDKGFSKMANRAPLEERIALVVIPKKGKLSAKDKERQSTKEWKALANKHSAIESNINCLEHHGLNRCPDKGIGGYRRYTGLGVLAYNLHKIGNHLLDKSRAAEKKEQKMAA